MMGSLRGATGAGTADQAAQFRGGLGRLWKSFGIPTTLLVMVAFFALATPAFMTIDNLASVLQRESVVAVAALGTTIIIIGGGIDLSMGSVIGLTTVVITLPVAQSGLPTYVTVAVALFVGALIGVISGLIITKLGVPDLITTLGILLTVRGLASIVSGNLTISGANLPDWFYVFGRGFLGPVPVSVIIVGALYIGSHYFMRKTVFGIRTYAMGSNETAARLSGVNVERQRVVVYGIGGLLSAVAGLILASRLGSGYALHGFGWELTIIAAVLLGGTSIFGGRGSVLRTLLGVIILGVLGNGLNLLNVSSFYQTTVTGVLLIGAVAASEQGQRSELRHA